MNYLDLSGIKLENPNFDELDVSSLGKESTSIDATAAVGAGVQKLGQATGSESISSAGSGASLGASVGGPWGAAIGGVVGGIAGGLSARSKRKAKNREIESNKISNIGQIQQQQGITQSNILQGLANNLSNTLV